MPKDNVLNFLESEQDRIIKALGNTDPLSDRYSTGLNALSSMFWLTRDIIHANDTAPIGISALPAENTQESEKESTRQPDDAPMPDGPNEPDIPAEAEKPQPEYTKAQVRKMLGDAQLQHPELNLPELIRSFGVAQLSDIPAERYPELLEKLDEFIAVKEST